MSQALIIVIQTLLIPLLSPLGVGIIRKCKAKFQNRQGASIFQPYRDLRKLFGKDEIISQDASWIFRAAPYIIFAVTIVIATGIPLLASVAWAPVSDILVLMYLLALELFFLALAGMDTASPFGGFGSSRAVTVMAVTEAGLLFSLLTLAVATNTTHFFAMPAALLGAPIVIFGAVVIAFLGFVLAMLAETNRYPFDNAATHLELTMIHEAMILEYSGKRLALIEWAAANKLLIFVALGVNLFFPWGVSTDLTVTGLLIGLGSFLLKALIALFLVATLESTIAKLRIFRIPDLLLTSFVLGVMGLLAVMLGNHFTFANPAVLFFAMAIMFISVMFMLVAKKNSMLVALYIFESLAVAGLLLDAGMQEGRVGLLISAAVTIILKACIVPYIFYRLIKRNDLTFSGGTYLSTPLTLLVSIVISITSYVVFAKPLAQLLPPDGQLFAVACIILLLLSLFLISNRKGAFSQIIGILSFENGIVALGLFLGLEQTLTIELGIAFDVLIWVMIATVFVSLVYRHFGTTEVNQMRNLKD